MWTKNLFLRIAGPTLLVSLLLLALCAVAGVMLYYQQLASDAIVKENIKSNHVADELETTLTTLIRFLRERNDQVGALHGQLRDQLDRAESLADKDEEKVQVGALRDSFERYLGLWEARLAPPEGQEDPVKAAIEVLENQMLPACKTLQAFNTHQIEKSQEAHGWVVQWMVAGLAGVGTVGSLAGVLLGYGVARGLRRSISHLSVRVQDAANKLGQDLPAVSLTSESDLDHLHERMRGVVREIEQVVLRLQQSEREVLRAEQLAAVGQLAAGVAHELRNPLTSIKMLVQANREDAEARGTPSEDLNVIELEIRRMERSLKTFLDFARPPQPERRPTDLRVPVERTLALVGGRARKQHVTVRFLPPGGPLLAEADAEQIQQLLVNLVLNALDVMPRGGTLEVELRRADLGRVEVRVGDTGPGIPADLAPRLFMPFVSSKVTGLGLGLVISRRIAESHGGTLTADNRPEGGAWFMLRLPGLVPEASGTQA
jgi:two-component system, NtrC family, sensor histidine kinase HydH